MRRMASRMGLEGPFVHENEQFEAFCRTLSSNRFCESYNPPKPLFPTLQQTEATIPRALDVRFSPAEVQFPGASCDAVLVAVQGLYRNQCFFKTTNRQIGIGLDDIMAGDVVAVLLGCRRPIILRQLPLPPSMSIPNSPRQPSTTRVKITDLQLYSGEKSIIQRNISTICLST
jgi:hypothetical protein